MIVESSTLKKFSYKKKGLSLDFSLLIDYPNDLSIFKEFLVQALKDIDKELLKFTQNK